MNYDPIPHGEDEIIRKQKEAALSLPPTDEEITGLTPTPTNEKAAALKPVPRTRPELASNEAFQDIAESIYDKVYQHRLKSSNAHTERMSYGGPFSAGMASLYALSDYLTNAGDPSPTDVLNRRQKADWLMKHYNKYNNNEMAFLQDIGMLKNTDVPTLDKFFTGLASYEMMGTGKIPGTDTYVDETAMYQTMVEIARNPINWFGLLPVTRAMRLGDAYAAAHPQAMKFSSRGAMKSWLYKVVNAANETARYGKRVALPGVTLGVEAGAIEGGRGLGEEIVMPTGEGGTIDWSVPQSRAQAGAVAGLVGWLGIDALLRPFTRIGAAQRAAAARGSQKGAAGEITAANPTAPAAPQNNPGGGQLAAPDTPQAQGALPAPDEVPALPAMPDEIPWDSMFRGYRAASPRAALEGESLTYTDHPDVARAYAEGGDALSSGNLPGWDEAGGDLTRVITPFSADIGRPRVAEYSAPYDSKWTMEVRSPTTNKLMDRDTVDNFLLAIATDRVRKSGVGDRENLYTDDEDDFSTAVLDLFFGMKSESHISSKSRVHGDDVINIEEFLGDKGVMRDLFTSVRAQGYTPGNYFAYRAPAPSKLDRSSDAAAKSSYDPETDTVITLRSMGSGALMRSGDIDHPWGSSSVPDAKHLEAQYATGVSGRPADAAVSATDGEYINPKDNMFRDIGGEYYRPYIVTWFNDLTRQSEFMGFRHRRQAEDTANKLVSLGTRQVNIENALNVPKPVPWAGWTVQTPQGSFKTDDIIAAQEMRLREVEGEDVRVRSYYDEETQYMHHLGMYSGMEAFFVTDKQAGKKGYLIDNLIDRIYDEEGNVKTSTFPVLRAEEEEFYRLGDWLQYQKSLAGDNTKARIPRADILEYLRSRYEPLRVSSRGGSVAADGSTRRDLIDNNSDISVPYPPDYVNEFYDDSVSVAIYNDATGEELLQYHVSRTYNEDELVEAYQRDFDQGGLRDEMFTEYKEDKMAEYEDELEQGLITESEIDDQVNAELDEWGRNQFDNETESETLENAVTFSENGYSGVMEYEINQDYGGWEHSAENAEDAMDYIQDRFDEWLDEIPDDSELDSLGGGNAGGSMPADWRYSDIAAEAGLAHGEYQPKWEGMLGKYEDIFFIDSASPDGYSGNLGGNQRHYSTSDMRGETHGRLGYEYKNNPDRVTAGFSRGAIVETEVGGTLKKGNVIHELQDDYGQSARGGYYKGGIKPYARDKFYNYFPALEKLQTMHAEITENNGSRITPGDFVHVVAQPADIDDAAAVLQRNGYKLPKHISSMSDDARNQLMNMPATLRPLYPLTGRATPELEDDLIVYNTLLYEVNDGYNLIKKLKDPSSEHAMVPYRDETITKAMIAEQVHKALINDLDFVGVSDSYAHYAGEKGWGTGNTMFWRATPDGVEYVKPGSIRNATAAAILHNLRSNPQRLGEVMVAYQKEYGGRIHTLGRDDLLGTNFDQLATDKSRGGNTLPQMAKEYADYKSGKKTGGYTSGYGELYEVLYSHKVPKMTKELFKTAGIKVDLKRMSMTDVEASNPSYRWFAVVKSAIDDDYRFVQIRPHEMPSIKTKAQFGEFLKDTFKEDEIIMVEDLRSVAAEPQFWMVDFTDDSGRMLPEFKKLRDKLVDDDMPVFRVPAIVSGIGAKEYIEHERDE